MVISFVAFYYHIEHASLQKTWLPDPTQLLREVFLESDEGFQEFSECAHLIQVELTTDLREYEGFNIFEDVLFLLVRCFFVVV